MADADRMLGGYDPNAGRSAHAAEGPRLIPVPSLLRALLSEHLDPGYAAAAAKRSGSATLPRGRERVLRWLWQALAALLIATVFAAAVAQARSVAPGVRTAQQLLVRSVRSTESDAAKVGQQRSALSTRVDDVQRRALADDAEGQRPLSRLDALSLAAASTPVSGPGLTVTVTDPGVSPNLSDVSKQRVNGSRQIILDRDLQLVVNSLWASGAEPSQSVASGSGRTSRSGRPAARSWSTTTPLAALTRSSWSGHRTRSATSSTTARAYSVSGCSSPPTVSSSP